uniref:Uncharacterized protein n=1 Tax=Strigamia maritima TaxID=126957 RepID=T1ITZ4_STRMM
MQFSNQLHQWLPSFAAP